MGSHLSCHIYRWRMDFGLHRRRYLIRSDAHAITLCVQLFQARLCAPKYPSGIAKPCGTRVSNTHRAHCGGLCQLHGGHREQRAQHQSRLQHRKSIGHRSCSLGCSSESLPSFWRINHEQPKPDCQRHHQYLSSH